MRASALLFALGLVGSVLAAPAPIARPHIAPSLFTKDPLSIHRRSVIPPPPATEEQLEAESEAETTSVEVQSTTAATAATTTPEIAVEDEEDLPPAEDSCATVCGVQRVEGAKSEREALCSVDGLHATLQCAQCIDKTWPDTTWEDSAMAEYERIVAACDDAPQKAFRRESS
ncbi:hypothetical protein CI109_106731 [Kwoniella shandongensis]|uniref:Uncharacterized protein n=1 Tax=Kwoniella shandongensis TaxID=1734106 RepID=A0A5M6C768_9TREE|nr:uncharacterized protein CI109_001013 [Kwoniella shandongensis]KAA5530833.1 hypothetical protein CI109_001013 [Kwoniella shandongensis]